MKGKVYFVGAGPGALDLLTIRAFGALQRAQVVLYDDLVAKEFIDLLPRDIGVLNVGKRCGQLGMPQWRVNQLMIEHAEQGRRVVRLKSGDPSVFGRLGEEIEALREAHIEFEIVPGVTAATAAAASVQASLTKRHVASQLVLAPGKLADGRPQDWNEVVRPNTTVVIYMPGSDYDSLAAELMAAGVQSDTPCAIVSRAGSPGEVTRVTTVEELSEYTPAPSPAVVIVGEVVREVNVQAQIAECDYGFRTVNRGRPVLVRCRAHRLLTTG
jgi:uroporphyrin-III C-methyltransferase